MHINICCFKWGDLYSPQAVNKLYDKVNQNLSYSFNFYCFTDKSSHQLYKAIHSVPLDLSLYSKEMISCGCWPKLSMFRAGAMPEDNITLYLDLDTMILNSLDPLVQEVAKRKGLHIIREWSPFLIEKFVPLKYRRNRWGNSSVVGFIPREQAHIYDAFIALKNKAYNFANNDQVFISKFAYNYSNWKDCWVKSFRRHCVFPKPFGYIFKPKVPPESCRVLIFHGTPNPIELSKEDVGYWGSRSRKGKGPVEWVKNYCG